MPVGNRQPVEAVNEGTGFVVALKVVHLTSVHHPYDNRIFHKECATLAAAGYQVTLVAPCAACDVIEGTVRVRALKPPPNRLVRALRTIPQVYWAALREDAALYHFHDPELMPVGALLRINGRKVIYDVHEDYAGSMAGKQWIPGLFRDIASWGVRICEHFFASRCSKVIAATPTIARLFPGLNVGLVQNFPWRHELAVADAPPYALRHPIVAHVGALSKDRGLAEMVRAVKLVACERDVKLILAGRVFAGAGGGIENESSQGLVDYVGMLSRPQVAALLASARVGIVTLHPTGNYVNSQPTKLYEYMSAGLPVIASDFPIWRQVVEPAGCGLLVDPLDPRAIADAIEWLLSHPVEAEEMGRRGRLAVEAKYNWEREGTRLVEIYADLLCATVPQSKLGSSRRIARQEP